MDPPVESRKTPGDQDPRVMALQIKGSRRNKHKCLGCHGLGKVTSRSRWSLSLGIFIFSEWKFVFVKDTPPIFFWLGIYVFLFWRWTWVRDSEGLHEVLVSDEMTSCTALIFKASIGVGFFSGAGPKWSVSTFRKHASEPISPTYSSMMRPPRGG